MPRNKKRKEDHTACQKEVAAMRDELASLKSEVMKKPRSKENTAKLLGWLLEGKAHGA